MRVLGIDYGDKNIGLALSDPFGWTAQGLETIHRENIGEYKGSLRRIEEIVKEKAVEVIVLGYPKNMDGTEGERCEITRVFYDRLTKRFPGLKIVLWDERLSSVGAERTLIEAGTKRKNRKAVIDKMAAVHILQGYLDSLMQRGI